MINIDQKRHEYAYDFVTTIPNFLLAKSCDKINTGMSDLINLRKVDLVDHTEQGTVSELDYGGAYKHHIFKGNDIRAHFPILEGIYYAILPLVSLVTLQPVVLSPYPDSDINIKSYPPGGGTIGWHKDTNGITVLLYTTTNTEGPLIVEIERDHPNKPSTIETKEIYAEKGMLLLMQGRKVKHMSAPTSLETKSVVVFNFYVGGKHGDTWRPSGFDDLVYKGVPTGNNS
ncbi:hypothetical protein [Cerasicoccus fimbriatus]|uniref:hypothetical protein n=1 Tax=Cerasicoccus fimbriatus TaxID=3014554 RepID=UPI0022B4232B|nr:hypothetical protein [Cerasicoccus sp. TK19100]